MLVDFKLLAPINLETLVAMGEYDFAFHCLLEYRRHGYDFAWIAKHTGLPVETIEATQCAALRVLAAAGVPHDELAEDYRLTRAQLAHVLAAA